MVGVPSRASARTRSFHYRSSGAFLRTLRRRVGAYFEQSGLDPRADPCAGRKSVRILLWLAVSYAALLLAAGVWWAGLVASVSLGLAAAAFTMGVLHDAVHGCFFRSPTRNRRVSYGAGVIGLDVNWWRVKHNRLHHAYTNIPGADNDIDKSLLLRLSPHQPRYPHHRLQHLYAWFLYPFLHLAMIFSGMRFTLTGKVGREQFDRPRGGDLAWSLAAKSLGVAIFLIVPLGWSAVPPLTMLGFLGVASATYSLILSCVFQVEHCVETSAFPTHEEATGRVHADWAACQVSGTANAAAGSAWLTSYTGGLNHHIEHHLLNHVSHVHYPDLAPIVRETCREFGLPYVSYPSYRSALAAHGRHLRNLGTRAPVLSTAGLPAARDH